MALCKVAKPKNKNIFNIIKTIIMKYPNIDINHQNNIGYTALHYLCQNISTQNVTFSIAKFLIKCGAHIDIKDYTSESNTPVKLIQYDILRYLLINEYYKRMILVISIYRNNSVHNTNNSNNNNNSNMNHDVNTQILTKENEIINISSITISKIPSISISKINKVDEHDISVYKDWNIFQKLRKFQKEILFQIIEFI
jgi:hypothetical protein